MARVLNFYYIKKNKQKTKVNRADKSFAYSAF